MNPKPTRGIGNVPDNLSEDLADFLGQVRRVLVDATADRLTVSRASRGSGTGDFGSGGGGSGSSGSGGSSEIDLTPPPNVSGLGITAGFGQVIIQWDAPTYTQGHGNKRTIIYAVKKLSSDAALPTFPGETGRVDEASDGLNIIALPSDLGVRWHVWAKFETNDGVKSVSPTGGVNGVTATTGRVGTSDLADLIVTADKLAGNIDATKFAAGIEPVTIVSVLPSTLVTKTVFLTSDAKLYRWNGSAYIKDVNGVDIVANSITAGQVGVGGMVAGAIAVGSAAIADGAIRNALIGSLAVDDAKMASVSAAKLLAGYLQVGAYVRSTSYVSGTSGWAINADGSAEFAAASIRGQLTASQIDTRNLTIKDGSGTVIFGSGTNLGSSYINAASGWLNSNVSLSSSGVLSGAGGGTVTIGGLGYSGDLDATKGAQLGTNLKDSGGSVLGDSAVKNTAINLTVNSNGTLSVSGGPGSSGGVTIGGLGYSGDLNATYGAAWGSTLTSRPANLASLAGSEAIKNGDITITIGAGGSLSASGGPSVSGAVTLSGLGAGAMAYIAAITSANVSTYINSAAINLAQINVASIGTLSALSSYLGTVDIATGGYLRSGQTAWSTGSGFWLGWVGSGPGEPGFSIGSSTAYLRYKPSTGLELKLDTFAVTFDSGDFTVGYTGNGSHHIGVLTASPSGGVSPYTYLWSVGSAADTTSPLPDKFTATRGGGTDSNKCDLYISSAAPTGATVTQYVTQTCTITDSNGRIAVGVVNVRVDWNGGTP